MRIVIPVLPSPVGLYGWRPLRALVWTEDDLLTGMAEGDFGYTGQAESTYAALNTGGTAEQVCYFAPKCFNDISGRLFIIWE